MSDDEPGDLRRDDALAMWRGYVAATGTAPGTEATEDPAVQRFGDTRSLAEELLSLVLAGTKRATAGLVADRAAASEPLPRIGGHWVACDGAGAPRCVLRTVELRLGCLDSVDDSFARDGGEDDRTRQSWLRGHDRCFRRTLAARGEQWDDDLEVLVERFRVVRPPEIADRSVTRSGRKAPGRRAGRVARARRASRRCPPRCAGLR